LGRRVDVSDDSSQSWDDVSLRATTRPKVGTACRCERRLVPKLGRRVAVSDDSSQSWDGVSLRATTRPKVGTACRCERRLVPKFLCRPVIIKTSSQRCDDVFIVSMLYVYLWLRFLSFCRVPFYYSRFNTIYPVLLIMTSSGSVRLIL
jgi:hypothetical protein